MTHTIRHFLILSFTLLLLFFVTQAKAQHIELLQQGKPTSIRGLSVVDDSVAWISGSKGYIAITTNGGKTWAWQQVKGFEQADFRDIEAFSAKEAVIMSSGTPALILKTIDGGASWQLKYKNTDTAYFLDAIDFADAQHGYILGDLSITSFSYWKLRMVEIPGIHLITRLPLCKMKLHLQQAEHVYGLPIKISLLLAVAPQPDYLTIVKVLNNGIFYLSRLPKAKAAKAHFQ